MRRSATCASTRGRGSVITGVVLAAAVIGGVVLVLVRAQGARSAFPGANGVIAFNRRVGNETDIAVVRPDRTGLRVLIRNAYGPAWSSDGRFLAFTRRSSGGDTDIWIANADGSGQRDLVSPDTNEAEASWSPDGQRLVIEASAHGTQTDELYVENTDGSGRIQLTDENRQSLQESPGTPKWSPRGDLIAFEEAGELFLIQPDGQGARDLGGDGTTLNPDWSPDGTQIVYDAAGRGNRYGGWDDLYTIAADGHSTSPQVTKTIDDEGNAAWSPSGASIVYTLWKTHHGMNLDHGDLYLTAPTGRRRWPLVRGAASKWGADWQPTLDK